jgi:hypothetical protein
MPCCVPCMTCTAAVNPTCSVTLDACYLVENICAIFLRSMQHTWILLPPCVVAVGACAPAAHTYVQTLIFGLLSHRLQLLCIQRLAVVHAHLDFDAYFKVR